AAVRVLLLEVSRTPNALRAGSTRETFEEAVRLVADVVQQGKDRGEFRADLDPMVSAAAILGAMELALSGIVVGLIGVPASGDEVERVKREVVAFALAGLRR
ncbi:MAG TPA: TetR/AcrR family transcriptional regulator, partial [Anaeromyxobacter sp.]